MISLKTYPISETALSVVFGDAINLSTHQLLTAFNELLHLKPFAGFIETVPAYTFITIYYFPEQITDSSISPSFFVKEYVENLFSQLPTKIIIKEKIISIPVCYDEAFGYDLEWIAQTKNISKEEIIAMHQQETYHVYMLGFLPGFAYLGEVADAIATPRKSSPRPLIAAGSVGIAGRQTGIYPLDSPGGWNIVGRTPLKLVDLEKENPFLMKAGDKVKFYAISKADFEEIKNQEILNTEPEAQEYADAIVLKPGVFSTIQDKGRYGFQSFGIPVGGAMDMDAYKVANYLVRNDKDAAVIECTMGGLCLEFKRETVIALTGGGMALINAQEIQFYQTVSVKAGDLLEIKFKSNGLRTYLAVKGGFKSKVWMSSRSTYAKAGIGSLLKKNDSLQFDELYNQKRDVKKHSFKVIGFQKIYLIRIIEGQEQNRMRSESIHRLYTQNFLLSNKSDRMGYHLVGETLIIENTEELISTAITKGTVQLTPIGQLIVMMSDCQTIGGYPRVAQVSFVDLPVLAQLKPGDAIKFIHISFEEAESLYLKQQNEWDELFG